MIDLRLFYAVNGALSKALIFPGVSLPPPNEAYGLLIEACVKCSVAFENQYQLQELLHTTDLSPDDLAEWAAKILRTDKEAVLALGKAFSALEQIG